MCILQIANIKVGFFKKLTDTLGVVRIRNNKLKKKKNHVFILCLKQKIRGFGILFAEIQNYLIFPLPFKDTDGLHYHKDTCGALYAPSTFKA